MVVAPSATAKHVGGARRPVALHRDASCRQVPPVRLAEYSRLPRLGNDRNRSRRRRDLRHPAQSVSRGLVAPARDVARQGQRSALHPDYHVQDVPVPARFDTEHSSERVRSDPRSMAVALEARWLVELRDRWLNPPEWVDWVNEPVPGYPKRPVPRDEGRGKGAQEVHADEPLQRPAAMARQCTRSS